MTNNNELRQYLELTDEGVIKYTLIKFDLESKVDTILFSDSSTVSEPINRNSILTTDVKNNIAMFITKIADLVNSLKMMRSYIGQLDKITVILPTELTTLKSQTMDASKLEALTINTLTKFLNDNSNEIAGQKRIIVEDKEVIVDGARFRFSDKNIPSHFTRALISSLNCYANAAYVDFINSEIRSSMKAKVSFISKGNVLKKDLLLNQKINSNQSKIIFDWGMNNTNVEVLEANTKERFTIEYGINNIVDVALDTLGITNELNKKVLLSTYLNHINVVYKSEPTTLLRTKDSNGQIVEVTNIMLKRAISNAAEQVIAQAVSHLVKVNNIYDANDAQKYHYGKLECIKGLKQFYKVIDLGHGLNNYIIENDFSSEFEGLYSDEFESAYVLAKNEKERMIIDLIKQQRIAADDAIFTGQISEERANLYKQKGFFKKEKISK